MKSKDYYLGFTHALIFLSDLFEIHASSLSSKRLLSKRSTKLVVAIIDACIGVRMKLADMGPRKLNMFIRRDGRVEFKEKQRKENAYDSNCQGNDPGAPAELPPG